MDISHEAARDAEFIISSRPRPLQKTSVTLSPGLVIQHRDRMIMFQAKHRVEVVTKFISCFQVAPLVESATFVIYISNHDTPNTRYWTLHWFRALLWPLPVLSLFRAGRWAASAIRRPSVTTKAALISSTDHGGGKRRGGHSQLPDWCGRLTH